MTILERETPISKEAFSKNIFVVFNSYVGIDNSTKTHANLAREEWLFYLDSQHDSKLQVDDGGLIFDNGEELVIPSYFTSSTFVKAVYDIYTANKEVSILEIKKDIRRKTGALIANITGRKVRIEHGDKTSDLFEPEN